MRSADIVIDAVSFLSSLNILIQAIENIGVERRNSISEKSYSSYGLPLVALLTLFFPGMASLWGLLLVLRLQQLRKWRGLFSGGSDVMTNLTLVALVICSVSPSDKVRLATMLMLAVQVLLSYLVAGWVKAISQDWRSGRDLRVYFENSVVVARPWLVSLVSKGYFYPMAATLVWVLELCLPLLIFADLAFIPSVFCGILFHLANFYLFGLNRFFWSWLAAYPALWLLHH